MIIQLLRVLRVKLAVHCTKKDQFCLCKATDGIFGTGDNFACITWTSTVIVCYQRASELSPYSCQSRFPIYIYGGTSASLRMPMKSLLRNVLSYELQTYLMYSCLPLYCSSAPQSLVSRL